MKGAIFGLAFAGGIAATPAAAFSLFQGDLFIIAVNNATACNTVNMQVSDFARFVYRPKSIAGNGTADFLSFNFSRSSGQLAPNPPATLDSGTVATLRTIGGSAGFSQIVNSGFNAVVSPPAPAAATQFVNVTVTINNIFSGSTLSGCSPTFRGTLTRRPGS